MCHLAWARQRNGIGLINESVLVQEFLVGKEYVIDKVRPPPCGRARLLLDPCPPLPLHPSQVSRDGVHKLVAIWEYDKRSVNGANFVYYGMRLMRPDLPKCKDMVAYADKVPIEPLVSSTYLIVAFADKTHIWPLHNHYNAPVQPFSGALRGRFAYLAAPWQNLSYAFASRVFSVQVLDALGIVQGPSHMEVMYNDSTGPCLVEVGSRCQGGEGTWLATAMECIGYSQVRPCTRMTIRPSAHLPPEHV